MKGFRMMHTITIHSKKHSEMIDITREVEASIPSNIQDGLCHLFCSHTTAGLTINENADPDVQNDINAFFNKLIPWNDSLFNHYEGNSAAHIKASLMGFAQTVPIKNGKLVLGTWQGIYFCEFDGPRTRNVQVTTISAEN